MTDRSVPVEEDPVARCVVRDGTLTEVSPRFAALVGVDSDALRGRDLLDVIAPSDRDVVRDLLGAAVDDTPDATCRVSLLDADGDPVEVALSVGRIDEAESGDSATVCVFVPLSGLSRPRAVSVFERATADLVRATTRREVCSVAVEALTDTLGLDVAGVYSPADGGVFEATTTTEAAAATLPAAVPTDSPVLEPFRTGEARVVPATEHDLTLPDLIVAPLGEHGVLVAAADSRSSESLETVRLLGANVRAALDRVRREERLARLHETTRSLMAAETEAEVADVAVTTARDVLSHDICAVHLYDPERDALVPVAASERTRAFLGDDGDLPAFERGESLAFEAFETGETRMYDRINEVPGVMDPTTRVRSELIVPLGDHGVFLAGSAVPEQFDETDVSLAKVLCANVESALERAEREATLRRREAELRERNDRLDEFASVVSHDLRNPLNVAQGRLELAREECSCGATEHLDAVAESHDRMAELVDDLLTLARQGRGVGETEPVDVGALARECWAGLGAGDLVVVDTVTVDADRSRLRELLENLLRNAVEHAGPDPTVRVGPLSGADGSEDVLDGEVRGFYVEDDGSGIPPDERDQVFEHGYSTDTDGTGFGLAIVGAVADAHGWDVRVTEGTAGGARFEFSL
jgi:PAS domain S-box-containing protein